MTPGALLLAFLLAGCAARVLPAPADVAADDPRVAACRREAVTSPEVLELHRRMPPASAASPRARANEAILEAEQDAFIDCLVRTGALASRPGGVERVRAPSFEPRPPDAPGTLLRAAPPAGGIGY
jgi:hypothetical protein